MKKWKYNVKIFLAIITGISVLTLNTFITTTIGSILVNTVMTNTGSNILIMATKGLTAYLGLSYLVCSSIVATYITTTTCARINENKKFATEEKPDIDQVLDIYKKEKQTQKITLEKQTYTMEDIKTTNYTIDDLKKEKEKLERNQIVTETKQKQKVLD